MGQNPRWYTALLGMRRRNFRLTLAMLGLGFWRAEKSPRVAVRVNGLLLPFLGEGSSAVFHLSSGCISWRHEPDMRPEIPQVPCRPGRFHHRTLQVSGRHGRFAQVAQNDLSFCFWWVSYSFASFIVTVLATPTLVYK